MTESFQQRKQWLNTVKKSLRKELKTSNIEIVSIHVSKTHLQFVLQNFAL